MSNIIINDLIKPTSRGMMSYLKEFYKFHETATEVKSYLGIRKRYCIAINLHPDVFLLLDDLGDANSQWIEKFVNCLNIKETGRELVNTHEYFGVILSFKPIR